MDGQNLTLIKNRIQQIKELLPEVFSEGRIDREKLRAMVGEDVSFSSGQLKTSAVLQMKDEGIEVKTK